MARRPRPDAHVAAVVLHGVLDDAEAEPGPARVPRTGLVDPVEALEDAVEVLPLDAHALVGDGDLDRVAHHLRADADPAALVGVGDRIGDQVVHGDDHERAVAVDLGLRRGAHRDVHVLRRRDDAVLVDRGGDDLVHGHEHVGSCLLYTSDAADD